MSCPRLLGLNHVALEVDGLDAALAFHGRLFRKSEQALAELRARGLA